MWGCLRQIAKKDCGFDHNPSEKRGLRVGRHVRGSQKRIWRSDPMDLDPRSYGIIDPSLPFCREIHSDHGSGLLFCREIHLDHRSQAPQPAIIQEQDNRFLIVIQCNM